MGLQLFTFAYNTLLEQSRIESSVLFLPKVLASMESPEGGTYLPVKVESWVTKSNDNTISNLFATQWFGPYLESLRELKDETPNPPDITQEMIDNAREVYDYITSNSLKPIPLGETSLEFMVLEIQGLSNINASGSEPEVNQSNTGYNCTIELESNAYQNNGDNWNRNLALGGLQSAQDSETGEPFQGLGLTMTQCLCFAQVGNDSCFPLPDGMEEDPCPVNLDAFTESSSGMALIEVPDATMIVDVTIFVAENGKELNVILNELTFKGESTDNPTYTLTHLAIEETEETEGYVEIWVTFAKNVIGTPEAAQTFTDEITKVLNSDENKSIVESTLNEQLANALDILLGPLSDDFTFSPDGNSNAVDQYIFTRIGDALNNPQSQLYLPKVILGIQSPVIEPYTVEDPIVIDGLYEIPFGPVNITVSEVELGELNLQGLSNLIAPSDSVTFSGEEAHAIFQVGHLNPGPTLDVNGSQKKVPDPPLTATSTFSMMLQVSDNDPEGPITGNITIEVMPGSGSTPAVTTALKATGSDPNTLELICTSIVLESEPEEINVKIELDDDSEWDDIVSALANDASLKSDIIQSLNSEINKILPEISQELTKFAKEQINNLSS